MINPTIKAQNLSLANVAAAILALPPGQFNFATLSQQYPMAQTKATYGLTSSQYRQFFTPDAAGGLNCGENLAPTLTNSTAARVANNMNKFVAWMSNQY
jgi:hypothetical protein